MRAACDRHNILLIFDEVITGFGRVGAAFAAERYGVTPDIITFAKGVTNGAVPMGGMIVCNEIHEAFMQGPAHASNCSMATPIPGIRSPARRVSRRSISIATRPVHPRRKLETVFEDAVHGLKGAPRVVDIRNMGLLAAIDLTPRDGAPGVRAAECAKRCFDDGVLIRSSGETLVLSPPLIIGENEIEMVFATIRRALDTIG